MRTIPCTHPSKGRELSWDYLYFKELSRMTIPWNPAAK